MLALAGARAGPRAAEPGDAGDCVRLTAGAVVVGIVAPHAVRMTLALRLCLPPLSPNLTPKRALTENGGCLERLNCRLTLRVFTGLSEDDRVWRDKILDLCGKKCQGLKKVMNLILKDYGAPKSFLRLNTLKN